METRGRKPHQAPVPKIPLFDEEHFRSIGDPRKAFIAFLSLPPQCRTIQTQKDLAELVGISERTVTKWKKNKNFLAAVKIEEDKFFDSLAGAVKFAIYLKALAGDPRAQKLWLQYFENWSEKLKIQSEHTERTEVFHLLDPTQITELQDLLVKQKKLGAPKKYIEYEKLPAAGEGET